MIPLVRTEVVDRFGPDLVNLIDEVSARLTTAVLSDLNAQVESGATDAAVAAALAEVGGSAMTTSNRRRTARARLADLDALPRRRLRRPPAGCGAGAGRRARLRRCREASARPGPAGWWRRPRFSRGGRHLQLGVGSPRHRPGRRRGATTVRAAAHSRGSPISRRRSPGSASAGPCP